MLKILRLKNFKIHRAISRFRLCLYNLAIVTDKWYNIEKQKQICKLCPGIAIRNVIHLLLDCPGYKYVRDNLFLVILETEEIDRRIETVSKN